jgi:hypothetical protein
MNMTTIADRPTDEMYRSGLEIDAQCARCGSSMGSENCWFCDDGITIDEDGCDTDDICEECNGRGVWNRCLSSPEWCEANPLPGRESVERGAIEWFTVSEPTT